MPAVWTARHLGCKTSRLDSPLQPTLRSPDRTVGGRAGKVNEASMWKNKDYTPVMSQLRLSGFLAVPLCAALLSGCSLFGIASTAPSPSIVTVGQARALAVGDEPF